MTYLKNLFNAQNHKTQGILWMICACFWFAMMATLIRYISTDMPPFEMVFFRNLFSVIWILPWVYKFGIRNIRTKRLKLYGYRTISGVAGMTMLFTALSIIPLTDAVALTFTVPIFTTILAIMFLGEKVGIHRWIAILIGFLGVLVILRPGSGTFQYASLLVIATTLCWSFSNIFVKKLTRTDKPKVIVFIMMVLMTPLSLPLALYVWQTPTLDQLLWLALLGWISNQAQFAMTHAYSKADMSVVLPFDFSRLIFISGLAYIFFGEVIDIWTGLGATIILASSVYVAKKEKEHKKKIPVDPTSEVV